MRSRDCDRCAWACLLGWACFVWMEHKAKQREADLDAHATSNGNGTPGKAERELELDLEELNRP